MLSGTMAQQLEMDEDYRNLPPHYPTLAEACDRVAFLQEHGFKARALAVLALPTDTAEELGEVTKGQPGGC